MAKGDGEKFHPFRERERSIVLSCEDYFLENIP